MLPLQFALALNMLERELLDRGYSRDDVVLVGTAPMVLAGLKSETPQDIDVFVRSPVYDALKSRMAWKEIPTAFGTHRLVAQLGGVRVEVMREFASGGIYDPARDQIDEAFVHSGYYPRSGWRTITLKYLYDWKMKIGRAKDHSDVRTLAKYLGLPFTFKVKDAPGY